MLFVRFFVWQVIEVGVVVEVVEEELIMVEEEILELAEVKHKK